MGPFSEFSYKKLTSSIAIVSCSHNSPYSFITYTKFFKLHPTLSTSASTSSQTQLGSFFETNNPTGTFKSSQITSRGKKHKERQFYRKSTGKQEERQKVFEKKKSTQLTGETSLMASLVILAAVSCQVSLQSVTMHNLLNFTHVYTQIATPDRSYLRSASDQTIV